MRDTFSRRGTAIPTAQPTALTAALALHPGKGAQWSAFLRRGGLRNAPETLEPVIEAIAGFLGPVLDALREQQRFAMVWGPGGPWVADNERKDLT